MHFAQFVRPSSGCASYLLGSEGRGACAVVDPAWEVEQYLQEAQRRGLRITHVIETHAHADHLSGARRLAARTGAPILAHPQFQPAFPFEPVLDGATVALGEVRLSALHTPGHRPDCLCLGVADGSRGEGPWFVLTGDTLFVGDVGRPDLGQSPEDAADRLYDSLFGRLLTLPDYTEVYPGHVAGSPCGRSMSPKGASTLGYERLFNAALQAPSRAEFIRRVVEHLPPQPPNFMGLVQKNRGLLPVRESVPMRLSPAETLDHRRRGALLVDLRAPGPFGQGHVEGAVNVPLRQGHFPTSAGWAISAETPLLLVLEQEADLARAVDALSSAGLDWIEGWVEGGIAAWRAAGLPVRSLAQLGARELRAELAGPQKPALVDVRPREDWARGHIPSAISIPLAELEQRLAELDRDRPVAFVCGSGVNSSVAASKALRSGLDAWNVEGGTAAWGRAGLDLETG